MSQGCKTGPQGCLSNSPGCQMKGTWLHPRSECPVDQIQPPLGKGERLSSWRPYRSTRPGWPREGVGGSQSMGQIGGSRHKVRGVREFCTEFVLPIQDQLKCSRTISQLFL